jgi:hypothetical protein
MRSLCATRKLRKYYRARHGRASDTFFSVGAHKTAAEAAVTGFKLPITAMPTLAGAAFNRTFAKWGIGGCFLGRTGHSMRLIFIHRVAISFSLQIATAIPTERQTSDAMTHRVP